MDDKVSEISKYIEVIEYMRKAHATQVRAFSLAPYYTHPIRVACLVMKYKESHKIDEIVTAALLHDVVEDTGITSEEIETRYGPLVRSLVDELTSNKEEVKKQGKTNYLKDKLVGLTSWALVIKLCDRLDNVSDFMFAPKKFIDKYSLETKAILLHLLQEKGPQLSDTHKTIIRDIDRMMSLF